MRRKIPAVQVRSVCSNLEGPRRQDSIKIPLPGIAE